MTLSSRRELALRTAVRYTNATRPERIELSTSFWSRPGPTGSIFFADPVLPDNGGAERTRRRQHRRRCATLRSTAWWIRS